MKIISAEQVCYEALVFIKDLHKKPNNIYNFGVSVLDRNIVLLPGTITLVSGRSGSGKTRFIRQMLRNFNDQGNRALYVSIESNPKNYGLKLLEEFDGSTLLDLRNDAQQGKHNFDVWKRRINNLNKALGDKIEYSFNNYLELEELKAAIRQVKDTYKMIVIDYIQAIDVKKTKGVYERNWRLAEEIRALAIECDVCIICVAQLNRQADTTLVNNPPSIANIEGSGHYEQTADTIILISRKTTKVDNYYKPTDDIDFYLAKNRGVGTIVKLSTNKKYSELIFKGITNF